MRPGYLILGLVTLSAVIGLLVSRDPERSAAMSQMYRDAALSGETKQIVLALLALGLGGFIVYLTMSRR
ncbi:hypothetical protein [Microvirga antarctica]|uniref:hypothetical protein n=1 Tax=Microvirga antarctica TaxID=2819233 RepID=UPI001B30DE9A|nr:hypothetical protein [Microvirga antarctica]